MYTEEEIISAYENAELCHLRLESFMESLTPIELPSDEEIEKQNPFVFFSHVFGTRDLLIWEQGAKWMRDKIQGGNK